MVIFHSYVKLPEGIYFMNFPSLGWPPIGPQPHCSNLRLYIYTYTHYKWLNQLSREAGNHSLGDLPTTYWFNSGLIIHYLVDMIPFLSFACYLESAISSKSVINFGERGYLEDTHGFWYVVTILMNTLVDIVGSISTSLYPRFASIRFWWNHRLWCLNPQVCWLYPH